MRRQRLFFFFFYNPEHLEIASGSKRKHVPYGALKDNSRVLVEQRYQPQGTTLQDPRNMSKDDLIAVLDHIHNWQVTFSGDAFRFSHFRTKNGRLHESRYPTDGNLTAGRTKMKQPAKKKGKRSKVKTVVSARRAQAVQEMSSPTAVVGNMEAGPPILVTGAQESGNSVDGDAPAIINYRQMTLLANSGVTGLMSITGPNQGSPTFVVLQSLVTRLHQLEDSTLIPKTSMNSNTPDCVIDPSLLGLSYTSGNNETTTEDNIQNLLDTTGRAKRGKKRVAGTDLLASGYPKKRRVSKAETSQPVGPTLRSAAKTQCNHGPEHSSSHQRTRGPAAKLGNTRSSRKVPVGRQVNRLRS